MKTTALLLISAAAPVLSGAGFVRHNNPAGFTVEHPEGWVVETSGSQSVAVRSRDGSSFVWIAGFVEPQRSASQRLAAAVARGLPQFPKGQILGVRQQSANPDIAVAPLAFAGSRGPGRANVMCAIVGGAGTLMAIAAPQAEFEAQRATLGRILASFSFGSVSESRGAGAAPALRYVRFDDPREGAFTVEVPAGWSTRGGLYRFAPVDTRPALETVSPDGRIRVMSGDPRIPTFAVPNQTLAFTGFREGSMYSPGYGVQMQVRRYMSGLAFAESYAMGQAGPGSSFRVLDRKDRPDFARYAGGVSGMQQATAGEVAFAFVRNGEPYAGYCVAATTLTGMYGMAMWNVHSLYCFTAPEQQVDVAQAAFSHMIRTGRVNPQWAAMQQGVISHSGATVAETGAVVSDYLSQSYWQRSASQDRLSRARSDATLGVVRLEDPTTGERFTVRNGSNYYSRIAGANDVLGNNTGSFPPQLDTRPLVQLQ